MKIFRIILWTFTLLGLFAYGAEKETSNDQDIPNMTTTSNFETDSGYSDANLFNLSN